MKLFLKPHSLSASELHSGAPALTCRLSWSQAPWDPRQAPRMEEEPAFHLCLIPNSLLEDGRGTWLGEEMETSSTQLLKHFQSEEKVSQKRLWSSSNSPFNFSRNLTFHGLWFQNISILVTTAQIGFGSGTWIFFFFFVSASNRDL